MELSKLRQNGYSRAVKILIISPIDQGAITELQGMHDVICRYNPPEDELKQLIVDREILVFRSGVNITADILEQAPKLVLLLRAGSGIDNLDVEYVNRRGLTLIRIPEPGAEAVAEMTFALILALSRNLLIADLSMRRGEWAKYDLQGYLLKGKVLGIIGVGNIGSRVTRLGKAWGMEVIGYDRSETDLTTSMLTKNDIRLTDFDEVISTSDYICLHVPLNEDTYHFINAEVLSQVKPGSYLINIARGGVVDEGALYSALVNGGKLRGAALDVHEQEGKGQQSPLAGLQNVILTPHIGAMTVDSQREIGRRVVEAVISNNQEG